MSVFIDLFKGKFLSRAFGAQSEGAAAPAPVREGEKIACALSHLCHVMDLEPAGYASADFQEALSRQLDLQIRRIEMTARLLKNRYDALDYPEKSWNALYDLLNSIHNADNGIAYFDRETLQLYADCSMNTYTMLHGIEHTRHPLDKIVLLHVNREEIDMMLSAHQKLSQWIMTQSFYDFYRPLYFQRQIG